MGSATLHISEDYWINFKVHEEDIEFLYNHLLETETPLTSQELAQALVIERVRRRKLELERQRMSGGDLYQPKLSFEIDQRLIFPALDWKHGKVVGIRPGKNPEIGDFQVIQVEFTDSTTGEYAAGLADHKLNSPPTFQEDQISLDTDSIVRDYSDIIINSLEEELTSNHDFVRIAGRWFPRALLIDINIGHMNIAEAVLDMAGGGPLPTQTLLDQIELSSDVNPKLLEFSLDLALQEDARFDEVGPAGDTSWFLQRLEPPEVISAPVYLRCQEVEFDRTLLTPEMLEIEKDLDDELSPVQAKSPDLNEVEVKLIFPHWRSGTLPLSARTRRLFPTAYEAPRVLFTLVDGETKEEFPGWVVRDKRFVYGLEKWYDAHGVIPGTIIQVRRGKSPGKVIVHVKSHRPSKEWVRTLLVGSDGGIVFAMLKQTLTTPIDDRMAIAIPNKNALDLLWQNQEKDHQPFEKFLVNTVKDLARLNPQSHVHISELYSAMNVTRRVPPGPILALLGSRPWFTHVGDLHYRLSDTDFD